MASEIYAILGVILFIHIAVVLIGWSIARREFIFFGGRDFGKSAHQVGIIFFIIALLLLYAVYVVYAALPLDIKTNPIVKIIYFGSLIISGFILICAIVKELITRFKELGFAGFSLRVLASFMTSVLIAYLSFKLGVSGEISEVQVASIFGVSLALSIQVG